MKPHGAGHGKAQGYNACMCRYCKPSGYSRYTSNVGRRAERMKAAQHAERRDAKLDIESQVSDEQAEDL